jgi:signal transduction histidine kinase
MGDRLGLKVSITSQGEEEALSQEIRTVLYRIVQECLTNVIRHAKADRVDVLLSFTDAEVCVRVEDNGCGFDVEAALNRQEYPCWGLLGMQERALLVNGKCVISSEPGMGTLIEVVVPLEKETHGKD